VPPGRLLPPSLKPGLLRTIEIRSSDFGYPEKSFSTSRATSQDAARGRRILLLFFIWAFASLCFLCGLSWANGPSVVEARICVHLLHYAHCHFVQLKYDVSFTKKRRSSSTPCHSLPFALSSFTKLILFAHLSRTVTYPSPHDSVLFRCVVCNLLHCILFMQIYFTC
jgi:hypothetical protein